MDGVQLRRDYIAFIAVIVKISNISYRKFMTSTYNLVDLYLEMKQVNLYFIEAISIIRHC